MSRNHVKGLPAISRKDFMLTAMGGLGVTLLPEAPFNYLSVNASKIKAVAFDAFAIFNPQRVFNLLTELYPDKGAVIATLWKTKQFEYTWLRTAAGKYKNFWEVTEDALVYAANATGISLDPINKERLMGQYLSLNVWPDVLQALHVLSQKGIRLCFLSNMTTEMLTSCMRYSKIEVYFEKSLSTDLIKTYKPDPRAYGMGPEALKLKKEEILFVAFAAWDAAGATWFSYPTFWVNRLQSPPEELHSSPEASGNSLADLISFLNF